MRKLNFLIAAALLVSLAIGCGEQRTAVGAAEREYYLGGMAAGFSLSAGGAEIVGFKEIATESGCGCPASEAGMRVGDVIVAIDGIHIRSVSDLNAALERSGGTSISVVVKRGEDRAEIAIEPVFDREEKRYKLGILIRDTLSGIGTVTYIDKNTRKFGALGHAVCSGGASIGIADPCVYLCSVIGVNRGVRGKAGELRGLFLNENRLGNAEKACDTGLYGTISAEYDLSGLQIVETAPLAEATIGKAVIYSTLDGTQPQAYEIAIAKVDAGNRDNKNFVIKVTDEKLIGEAGGIVQGMSGSPILQNGKLIGAVTHVFLNDPTRGYGIGIEKMFDNE